MFCEGGQEVMCIFVVVGKTEEIFYSVCSKKQKKKARIFIINGAAGWKLNNWDVGLEPFSF